LPYYRQEKQFERIGVTVSRQDMSNWQQQAYKNLSPLFGLLKETVKSGPVIQMDETTVQVMGEEGRDETQKSYMWLARGGPPGNPRRPSRENIFGRIRRVSSNRRVRRVRRGGKGHARHNSCRLFCPRPAKVF
jgi:hypothetical protein